MATHFKYKFDKVHIKRGHYYPKGYGDLDSDQYLIRKGLVDLLANNKPLPVFSIIPEKQFEALTSWQKLIAPQSD